MYELAAVDLVGPDRFDEHLRTWLEAIGLSVTFPFEDFVRPPVWLRACFDCAKVTIVSDGGNAPDGVWPRFILMLSRMPDLTASIETVAHLSNIGEATRTFIRPQLLRFDAVTQRTPFLDGLAKLQMRRARRIDGRAHRAPDVAYDAETERGARLSKRERARLPKK